MKRKILKKLFTATNRLLLIVKLFSDDLYFKLFFMLYVKRVEVLNDLM